MQNIHEDPLREVITPKGGTWRYLDLSGQHLGVRIEELATGETSSTHHFHTLEEEHVVVLEGGATLILGAEEHPLRKGDHVWFAAGEQVAHHIENRTDAPVRYLVFGERNEGDIDFYPDRRVMMVKALGWKSFPYEEPKSKAPEVGDAQK